SPALNGALTPLSYAVGRYVGRWPVRAVAAVAGTVVVAEPWTGGEAGEQVSRWLGGAVLVLLPGAVGVYRRTRALLLAALRDQVAPLGPQPGLADLGTLVAQARDAGMAVDLTGLPDGAAAVDPAAGRAAYRIVQESLTNAAKHAPGAAVRICVERQPAGLVVR